jgi:hypothetical protein
MAGMKMIEKRERFFFANQEILEGKFAERIFTLH